MATSKTNAIDSGCTLWSDDVCVYLIIKVRNALFPKIVLFITNLFLFGIIITAVVEGIIGLVIFSLLFSFMLLRYTLWNYFGQEQLIINTASLSYLHDYGVAKTNLTTKAYSKRLSIVAINEDKQSNGQPASQICFTGYDPVSNLPVELYRTTFYVDHEDINRMLELVNDLFVNEVTNNHNMPQINLN